MSFTDEQLNHVLDYFSNASDDEGGPEVWTYARTELPLIATGELTSGRTVELLEELRDPTDYLDPIEEAEEIAVRASLRLLPLATLATYTRFAFMAWQIPVD